MKRPAFQFYPADWRKDAALQSCSVAARGLWIDALCIAHECEPYGHLTINGTPMNAAQIGRLVGLAPKESQRLLDELLGAGVASRNDAGGAIYSRRMVRDEDLRNRRGAGGAGGAEHGIKGKEHGIKGGRPKADKVPEQPPLIPPPSSSSSSSTSVEKTPPTPKGDGRFPEFWSLWPRSPRKGGKPEALKVWQANGLDREAPAILAHVASVAKTEGWTKQGGEFVPAPVVYLRGRRWDGADTPETRAAATAADWRRTKDGVQTRAYQLGLGPYEQIDATGHGVSFNAYRAKVIAADEATREPA